MSAPRLALALALTACASADGTAPPPDAARDAARRDVPVFEVTPDDASVDARADAPDEQPDVAVAPDVVDAPDTIDVVDAPRPELPAAAGDVVFEAPVCVALPAAPERASAHDLDGDGARDLVWEYRVDASQPAGFGYARGLSTRGALRFGPLFDRRASPALALGYAARTLAADLDGDGAADLVRDVAWWRNGQRAGEALGEGSFAGAGRPFVEGLGFTTPDAATLHVADVDGDGARDLLAAHNPTSCNVHTYLGRGDGAALRFDPQVISRVYVRGLTRCSSMAVGDLDGDGALDAVVTSDNADRGSGEQGLALLRNASRRGAPDFVVAARVTTAPQGAREVTAAAALADLDGDGRADLVYTARAQGDAATRPVGALRTAASALSADTFGAHVRLPAWFAHGATVRAAALDGDGRADLASLEGARVVTLQGRAVRPGALAADGYARATFTLPAGLRATALGDVDGDGLDDLVAVGDDRVCALRNATP